MEKLCDKIAEHTYYVHYCSFRRAVSVMVLKLCHAVINSRVLDCWALYPQFGPTFIHPYPYSVIQRDCLAVLLPSDARSRLACYCAEQRQSIAFSDSSIFRTNENWRSSPYEKRKTQLVSASTRKTCSLHIGGNKMQSNHVGLNDFDYTMK